MLQFNFKALKRNPVHSALKLYPKKGSTIIHVQCTCFIVYYSCYLLQRHTICYLCGKVNHVSSRCPDFLCQYCFEPSHRGRVRQTAHSPSPPFLSSYPLSSLFPLLSLNSLHVCYLNSLHGVCNLSLSPYLSLFPLSFPSLSLNSLYVVSHSHPVIKLSPCLLSQLSPWCLQSLHTFLSFLSPSHPVIKLALCCLSFPSCH